MCYSAKIENNLSFLTERFSIELDQSQIELYENRSRILPKNFKLGEQRIYPGYYAPVLTYQDHGLRLQMMRYGVYPPSNELDRYRPYNARKDKLETKFWAKTFAHFHGFVLVKSFFEWVVASDLLDSTCIPINELLESLATRYKNLSLSQEQLLDKKLVIEFYPEREAELWVPVVFTQGRAKDGKPDYGFAIVTDEPPKEVLAAGHDRCPVFLTKQQIKIWLQPQNVANSKALLHLLSCHEPVKLRHRLDV